MFIKYVRITDSKAFFSIKINFTGSVDRTVRFTF